MEADFEPAQMAPHSQDAEEATHGSILINPDAYHECSFLKPGDFFILRNAWIWEAFERLVKRGVVIDYGTVIEELRTQGRLDDIGGAAYITYLTSCVGTSIYGETYARIVQRAALRRRMLDASLEIARLAREEDADINAVLADAQIALDEVTNAAVLNDWTHVQDVVDTYFDAVEARKFNGASTMGIISELTQLDGALRGFHPGRLYIVAARPGMGKTWFLLYCALKAALAGKRVGIMSLEMSREELVNRLLSLMTGINSRKIEEGDLNDIEWSQFVAATGQLAILSIFIDDSGWQTPTTMRHKAKRLKARYGIDILFFDYLQLGGSDNDKDKNYERVTKLSMALAGLTKPDGLNIPVVAASQLNRDLEERKDKRPMLSDLRESGQIEQDSSAVLFLYRDFIYHPEPYDIGTGKGKITMVPDPCVVEIIIAKNRHNGGKGAMGSFEFYYDYECPNFNNLTGKRTTVHLNET